MQTWTTEQARSFLSVVSDDDLAAFWYLALYTGMRRGEMLALRWSDVDFQRGQLAVRRTLSRGEEGLVISEPKTKAGRRSIALPEPVIVALRAHRSQQLKRRLALGADWIDLDLVFDRGDGTIMHSNNVTHAFPRIVRRVNSTLPQDRQLPAIRLHDLRHTAATLMLANGEHPKIVQERLGHADISMTLNRYSHVTTDMQRDASDRLAKLLSG
jgi:integrase